MSKDIGNDRGRDGAPVRNTREMAAKVDNPPGGAALFMRAAQISDEYMAAASRDGASDQVLHALATTLPFALTLAAHPEQYDAGDGALRSAYRRHLAKLLLEMVAEEEGMA
jgi:hypothetical protein